MNGEDARVILPDVLLQVMFFTSGRLRYTFDAGATGASGRATISYSDMENERVANGKFALMDYNTKLEECDPEAKIHVLTQKDFEQKLSALKLYYPSRLSGFERQIGQSNNLKLECRDVVVELSEHVTKATVICRYLG